MAASNVKEVTVIGAGVIGLTTAIKLQETGKYHVTIVAEILPTDPKSSKYTSQWAGAFCYTSPEVDGRFYELSRETYDVLAGLADGEAKDSILKVMHQDHYLNKDIGFDPSSYSWMPKFRYLTKEELKPGALSGITFETYTIDVPVYLRYLLSRFEVGGGNIVRGTVQHIDSIVEGGPQVFDDTLTTDVKAVVVCTGLGSRTLLGVEDQDIYPVRGQTVRIHAPWVKNSCIVHGPGDTFSHYIPRKGGDVLVGGIRGENDWYPKPRLETTNNILERAESLFPELLNPDTKMPAKIVESGCGLRPARVGGVRIEVEHKKVGEKQTSIPVIHNYGHAGSGFQASWGSASAALRLLDECLDSTSSDL